MSLEVNNNLKAIDWELGQSLLGGDLRQAKALMQKFIVYLADTYPQIQESYIKNDREGLLSHIHKLHGACCYCGVPQLKDAVKTFEKILKLNELSSIQAHFDTVCMAVQEVLNCAQQDKVLNS